MTTNDLATRADRSGHIDRWGPREMKPAADCPNVFDAGLPSFSYQDVDDPHEAHRRIREARDQAPIAMGPYGPELLSYELVRAVLRDPRFCLPKGMALAAQGITSGPLWDRVAAVLLSLDGVEHDRLRRLVSHAFTPRAITRLRPRIINVINELVDGYAPLGICEVVSDIARQYPVPIICALLGAPSDDWELISNWADDIRPSVGLPPITFRRSSPRGTHLTPTSMT